MNANKGLQVASDMVFVWWSAQETFMTEKNGVAEEEPLVSTAQGIQPTREGAKVPRYHLPNTVFS